MKRSRTIRQLGCDWPHKVELTDSFVTCIAAWQNFFDSECRFGPMGREGVALSYINKKLKPYGGQYFNTSYPVAIVFDTEQEMALWLLKWS